MIPTLSLAFSTTSAIGIHLTMTAMAVLQGVTEFLPVSSSGHLALAQWLTGVGQGSLVDDIALHVGTLFAVIVFYRRDLIALFRGFLAGEAQARRYVGFLLLGNLPAAAVGLGLEARVERLFDLPWAVLLAMSATAILLWSTRRVERADGAIDLRRTVLIGLAQGIAVLPGASRSGWTIATALWTGVRPSEAARFSFLLSLPAIGGATILQARDFGSSSVPVTALLLGIVVSALVGILCLRWLVALVRNMALHRFGIYLAVLVLVGVIVSLVGQG